MKIGKNALERIMAKPTYGYGFDGTRNKLIGITVQELCTKMKATYYNSWLIKDKEYLLAIKCIDYSVPQEYILIYTVILSDDESVYSIDVDRKMRTIADSGVDFRFYNKKQLQEAVKKIKAYKNPKIQKFK